MEKSEEYLVEVVKEELMQLGVSCDGLDNSPENKKVPLYQYGSKFLGLAFSNNLNQSKEKGKSKLDRPSPKVAERSRPNEGLSLKQVGPLSNPLKQVGPLSNPFSVPQTGCRTPSKSDSVKWRRTGPKSPFSLKSRGVRRSGRRKAVLEKYSDKEVFGQDLQCVPMCPVKLADGTVVHVPEFIIDLGNLIRCNINVEGIFRKAGSSQRQSDVMKLLKSGVNFPLSIHPIDGACLLKQYLRSLPTPLLPHPVHYLMTNCLEISDGESQQKALSLCSLLLPKTHQDLLSYILELLSDVASASELNMMDARNLAIVLAPNILPELHNSFARKSWLSSDDHLLKSTIIILERLIEGATWMCRVTENVADAITSKERSHSVENLVEVPPPSSSQKKKRRSASLYRLMNGIRKVVQGGGSFLSSQPPSDPIRSRRAMTPRRLTPATDRKVLVKLHPEGVVATSPRAAKRKSEVFDSPRDNTQVGNESQCSAFDPPKKKARMEVVANVHSSSAYAGQTRTEKATPIAASLKTKHPKVFQSLVSVKTDGSNKVVRRFSLKEKESTCSNSDDAEEVMVKNLLKCGISKTPLKVMRDASLKPVPITFSPATPSSVSPLIHHPNSSILLPLRATTPALRKSNRRRPFADRSQFPLGPRGVPDGSECDTRKSASNIVNDLEQQYDEIKFTVKLMEDEMDRDNIRDMKESALLKSGAVNLSCSQMIHDAYERMKAETKNLEIDNQENLGSRLGKELKVKSCRSGDNKVIRSPSERKIGSIRRRSKELAIPAKVVGDSPSNSSTPKINICLDESNPKPSTPRLKSSLMQSPLSVLRRGKPNSLRSGLPIVVKPANTVGLPGVMETPSGAICITKRPSSKKTPVMGEEYYYSQNSQISRSDLNESFIAKYSGPVTRSRSSILSLINTPFPTLDLKSAENALDEQMTINEVENVKTTSDINAVLNETFTIDGPHSIYENIADEKVEWVSAATYMSKMVEPYMSKMVEPSSLHSSHCSPPVGNRPSIAALRRQKKVTANVQLFSQLQSPFETHLFSARRSSRCKTTPYRSYIPLRQAASERRGSRVLPSTGLAQMSLTPRGHPPISVQMPKGPLGGDSPLPPHTPRIMQGMEGVTPRRLRAKNFYFIFPGGTPLPPHFRSTRADAIDFLTPSRDSYENSPMLPPRSTSKSSMKLRSNIR